MQSLTSSSDYTILFKVLFSITEIDIKNKISKKVKLQNYLSDT